MDEMQSMSQRWHRSSQSQLRARTWAASIAVLIACSALGIGCGSGSTERKAGDTLTVAIGVTPSSLDPSLGQNQNAAFLELAYDSLIVQAPDGSYQPGLATKWEYGPRNESFTITLRKGVKFSDGEKLDAEAVKGWIEHELEVPGSTSTTYFSELKSIDVSDPQTLTLNFKSPTPQLEKVFSQVLEMGMIGSPKAVQAKTLTTETAGAGPYVLDKSKTVPNDHYTYVANPLYWNKRAVHWKKVVVRIIENPNATLQALKTGQVQVAIGQPATSIDAAERDGLKYVSPLTLYMGLGLLDRDGELSKPLGDVRVRQAINYAIDRKAVAKVVGAGHGRPTAQMAVPGDDSYDEALNQRYRYDPDKAKRLLDTAGYSEGFTLPTLTTNLVGMDQLAQAVAGQLEKVGIDLKLDVITATGDYTTRLGSARYPAATLAFGRLPAATNYQLLWGPNAALFNPFKSADVQITALNNELVAASGEEAETAARKIQARLVEQAWFAPVVATPLVTLYRPEVTGVNASSQRNVVFTQEIAPAS